jgi:glutaredoxin-like protein NrdH
MAIEYEKVEGAAGPRSLILYSLSFCASCREASSFLRELGLGFRYAYVDQLPDEERLTLKKALTPANPRDLMYPILEIDGAERLYGYKREIWQARLAGPGAL